MKFWTIATTSWFEVLYSIPIPSLKFPNFEGLKNCYFSFVLEFSKIELNNFLEIECLIFTRLNKEIREKKS